MNFHLDIIATMASIRSLRCTQNLARNAAQHSPFIALRFPHTPCSIFYPCAFRTCHAHMNSSSSRYISSQLVVQPVFSAGSDEKNLLLETVELLESQWLLDEEQMGFTKTYYFKTYTKALDFVQIIGIRSKSKNHHPTITLRSGSVAIHWTTHHPRGLSFADAFMARYCDEQASLIGTVPGSEAQKCNPSTTRKA